MRYELTEEEWTAIRPLLPSKPRGVPRVNDRRVLKASSGSCDLGRHGATCRRSSAHTPLATRFVRWRRAGVSARIMSALAGAYDAAVQMIDASIVRVHQHGAYIHPE
jgi:transposase